MEGAEVFEETAFDLKRKGDFDKALHAYAQEYIRNESKYVARLCFEEMIDIMLLKYLREQRKFENRRSLTSTLENDMVHFLKEMGIWNFEDFRDYFGRSKSKLFPRGRGKAAFSVHRNLLLRTSESKKQSTPAYIREKEGDYTV